MQLTIQNYIHVCVLCMHGLMLILYTTITYFSFRKHQSICLAPLHAYQHFQYMIPLANFVIINTIISWTETKQSSEFNNILTIKWLFYCQTLRELFLSVNTTKTIGIFAAEWDFEIWFAIQNLKSLYYIHSQIIIHLIN